VVEKMLYVRSQIDQLEAFYAGERKADLGVSLRLIREECCIRHPSALPFSSMALDGRIYCLLKKWDACWRCGPHKAQNTRHVVKVMREVCLYGTFKASPLGVECCTIFSADETHVNFLMEGINIYLRSERTVAIKGAESASRCTVMFASNLAGGIELPPLANYTGASSCTGEVKREVESKVGYPHQMKYNARPKGRMDEHLMLQCIEQVWKPSLANSRSPNQHPTNQAS
jgi:DDE superfamily endonuclease